MTSIERERIISEMNEKRKSIKSKKEAIHELKRIGYLTKNGTINPKFNR